MYQDTGGNTYVTSDDSDVRLNSGPSESIRFLTNGQTDYIFNGGNHTFYNSGNPTVNIGGGLITFYNPGVAASAYFNTASSNPVLYSASGTMAIGGASGSDVLIQPNGSTALDVGSGSATVTPMLYLGSGETITGGHVSVVGGTAPTLTSCGTSPSTVTGTDIAGRFTEGSSATGCTINFNASYTNTAGCRITNESGYVITTAPTATTVVITNVGPASSTVFDYDCTRIQ